MTHLTERDFGILVERHPDALAVVAEGRIVLCSPVIEEALGRRPGDLLGLSPLDLVHPDECDRIEARMAAVLAGAPSKAATYRAIGRDGIVHLEIRSAAIGYGGGPALLSSVRDVTDRIRAEDELRQSERRLRESQRIALVGTWEWDAEQDAYWVSDELFEIFALERRPEDMREAFFERVHPDDQEILRRSYEQAMMRGEPYSVDYRVLPGDGTERFVHSRAQVVRTEQGEIERVIGTIQDVTERVLLQARLKQSEKLEALGRLAGGVAHDFNNLLTVIRGHAELLLTSDPAPEQRVALEKIMEGAEMGASLTRELLTFGRQDVREPRAIFLDEVVERIRHILERTLPADVTLVVETGLDGLAAVLDPVHADQILLNLALNARDAMAGRGGTLTIRTMAGSAAPSADPEAAAEPVVCLQVSDTGRGIAAELQSRIFEPYFTTKGMGSGLGLATVFGVVEDAGGAVAVESEPGRGATFTVSLPAARETRTGAAPVAETVDGAPAWADAHQGTILVAEDDERVRDLVTFILRGAGFDVVARDDGATALRALQELDRPIDLLVTDVMMPVMKGPELSDEVRAIDPGIPVIFMSGYGEEGVLARSSETGPSTFLGKPFSPAELLGHVRRLVGARAATTPLPPP